MASVAELHLVPEANDPFEQILASHPFEEILTTIDEMKFMLKKIIMAQEKQKAQHVAVVAEVVPLSGMNNEASSSGTSMVALQIDGL